MKIERMAAALAVVGALLVGASPASAQLGIGDVVTIVKAVHDAERVNLGAGSTREGRNEFFARAIGIVVYGHPKYNPTPDPRWCIKDGGGGRPQSDDVVVFCDTREAWDLIGNAGAAGYSFHTDAIGKLPAGQNVYAPPRPKDATPGSGEPPTGGGGTSTPPAVNLSGVLEALARLEAKVDALAGVAVSARDAADEGRAAARSAAHDARELNAFRLSPEFAAVFSWFVSVTGRDCVEGSVPKAFGGSTRVRFCLAPAGQ